MKKLLLTIITVVIFSFQSAFAFVPLVVPVIAVASAALILSAAGVYYSMNPASSSSHFVDSVGNVARSASCLYVALTSAPVPVPEVETVPVKAKIPYSQVTSLSEKLNADGSKKYPLTYNKSHGPDAPDIASSSPVGAVVATSWGVRKITSKSSTSYCQLNVSSIPTSTNGGATIVIQDGYQCSGSGSSSHQTIFYTSSSSAPIVVVTPAKFVSNLSLPVSGGAVTDSSVQSEIDHMLQDPDYVPSFTDDTTDLPYYPPAGLPSAAQIASAVAHANAVASAADALASAQNSASQADIAASQAAANSAAHPDDPALQNAAASAASAAAAARAAADALAAQQARSAADDVAVAAPADPKAYGDGEKFDFGARMRRFIEEMKATSIFSLPSQVLGNIPGGGTSVMNVSFGRMGSTSFDFADFSGSLAVLRVLVLIVFSYCGFRIVTLKGGGG